MISFAQDGAAPPIATNTQTQNDIEVKPVTANDVERWRAKLMEGSIDDRRATAIQTRKSPIELNVQLLPVFLQLLEHEKDGQMRLAVLDTLKVMGPSAHAAVPVLLLSMRQKFGGRHNEETHQDYRAALALANIGAPAVDGLIALLTDESEGLRAESAMALGRIGAAAKPAMQALVALLDDKSQRVQRDAVSALGKIGEAATEPLLQASRHENVVVRANSLAALGQAAPNDQRVAELVQLGLQDDHVEIRRIAASLLLAVRLPEATRNQCLLQVLADEDRQVSAAGVNSVMQQPTFVQEHRTNLAVLLIAQDDTVAWHAAFLLQLSGAGAVPLFLDAATNPSSRLEHIARALSLMSTPLEPLLYDTLASQEPRLRQVAALALGMIRPLHPNTVEQLSSSLESNDDAVQAAILQALSSLGTRASPALPVVRRLMQHKYADGRIKIIQILSQAANKNEQLVLDLSGFLHDAEPNVQRAAIDSLRALGPLSIASIPAVTQLIGDASTEVRESALAFLGSHGPSASGSLPSLQAALAQSNDAAGRIAILKTLTQLGEAARPAYDDLANLLVDADAKIRETSLQTVFSLRLDLEQLQPHLLRALKDTDAGVQSQATDSIRRLGARSAPLVPEIITLLQDDSTAKRATEILERLERYPVTANTIPALLELVSHDNATVQLQTIRFLGLAGKEAQSVVQQLEPYLQSDNEALQAAAKKAIDSISAAD